MKALDIGLDAASLTRLPGRGRVLAVLSQAIYVELASGILAVTSATAPRGPLHLRVRHLPRAFVGDSVTTDGETLSLRHDGIDLAADVWAAAPSRHDLLPRARENALRWRDIFALDFALDADHAGVVSEARCVDALATGDLCGFAKLVSGRGPGLTPAGDDVLAGVLLVAHVDFGGISGGVASTIDEIAKDSTNTIARAFLRSALRGRSVEPAHDFLQALGTADMASMNNAATALRRIGASSGIALAYGSCLALASLPERIHVSSAPVRIVDDEVG
jgi:hypothetical protein